MKNVREILLQDYPSLSRFLEHRSDGIVGRDFYLDCFEHWWEKNPAMSAAVKRGWIIFDADNIAGFFGNIPVKYMVNGKEEIFCSATNWSVEKKLKSSALLLYNSFLKQNCVLLDTTPSSTVTHILKRTGFNELNDSWLAKDAFYILSPGKFYRLICRKIAARSKIPEFIKIFSPLFVAGVKISQVVKFRRTKSLLYSVRAISAFDVEYDNLWNKLKRRYDIVAVRDSECLNWFFFGFAKLKEDRKVFALRKGNDLIGYMAFKVKKHHYPDEEYLYWEMVDVFLDNASPQAQLCLFESVLKESRNCDRPPVYILINPAGEILPQALNRSGFLFYRGHGRFFYRNLDIRPGDSFYATPLDGDRVFS